MFSSFIATVKTFFHAKVQPAIADAEAVFQQLSPYALALLNVLHTLGITHDHVTQVAGDVIAIGNQAISGADKLVAVAQGIQQLAADGVINPKAAEQAKTVAQITYSLVKEAGLLKAAA